MCGSGKRGRGEIISYAPKTQTTFIEELGKLIFMVFREKENPVEKKTTPTNNYALCSEQRSIGII